MDSWARAQIEALQQRVAALEAQLANGGAPAGAGPEAIYKVAAEEDAVVDLLRQGKMVQAVALHRERTGADITTAKAAVERLAAQLGL